MSSIHETVVVLNEVPFLQFQRRAFSFFCSYCKTCFQPVSIVSHFKKFHHEIDLSFLKKINFMDLYEKLIKESEDQGFKKEELKGPFPIKALEGFPINQCIKCSIQDCNFMANLSAKNISKIMVQHIKESHPDLSFSKDLFYECYGQALSKKGRGNKLFHVLFTENEYDDEENISPSKLDTLYPTVIKIRSIYEEIGFIFDNRDKEFHYELSSEKYNEKHVSVFEKLELIKKKLKKSVNRSIEYLKEEGVILKKIIGTTTLIGDTVFNRNNKLLRVVERETLEKYTNYFLRFLYFLIRIPLYDYGYIESRIIDLSYEQYFFIKNLKINMKSIFSANDLNEDIITILKEKYLESNGKFSILTLFLKCCCITERLTYVSVESISSYCTAIKYISRLACLMKIKKELERRSNNANDFFLSSHDESNEFFIINKTGIKEIDNIVLLIKNNISYPFGQILNISNYCRKFRSYERIPTVSWEKFPDNEGLGGIMNLSGFYFYVEDILDLKKTLINEIISIYEKDFYIDMKEVKILINNHDDFMWHKNGIIKENINFFKDNEEYSNYIKDYIFYKLKERKDFYSYGKWNLSLLSILKEKIDSIVKRLFVLIHISSGGVARSTEYEDLYIKSFDDKSRNIFIDNYNVVIVSYIKKTSKHSDKKKIIPRFMDKMSSLLIVIYIAIIKPFDCFIYFMLLKNNIIEDFNNNNNEIKCLLFNIRYKKIKKNEYREIFNNIFTIRDRRISFKEFRHINHMISHFISQIYPYTLIEELKKNISIINNEKLSNLLRFYLSSSVTSYFINQSGHTVDTAGHIYGYGYHPYINHYDYLNFKNSSLLYNEFIENYKNTYINNNNIEISKNEEKKIFENNEINFEKNKYKIDISNIEDKKNLKEKLDNILEKMGVDKFFSIEQKKSIIYSLLGYNVILRINTGGGKTFIYELSELLDIRNGVSFLFLPYNSLIDEKLNNLRFKNIIKWGCDKDFNRNYLYEKKILIIASYQSLINNSYGLIEFLKEKNHKNEIRTLIFDEFDYIFGYNNEKIESFEIIGLVNLLKKLNVKMIFLSSTFRVDEINYIHNKILENDHITKKVISTFDKKNISYNVVKYKENININLLNMVNNYIKKKMKIIIFCMTIDKTIDTYEYLKKNGLVVSYYYSSLKKEEKEKNLRCFIRNETHIMVSTTALGVGINIKDIRVVIHLNGFFSLKNFIQETGRVGRDGYPSISYVLLSINDFIFDENVRKYINSKECRRKYLHIYMDNNSNYFCSNDEEFCDNCKKKRIYNYELTEPNEYMNEYVDLLKDINVIGKENNEIIDDISLSDFENNNFERKLKDFYFNAEKMDYEEIMDFIINSLKKNERCPYCYIKYTENNRHIIKDNFCNMIDSFTCIRCFRKGHTKSECKIFIDTKKKYCYFCLLPSRIYNSRMDSKNYHNEEYGKCDRTNKDVIKSYLSNLFIFIEEKKNLKEKFMDEIFRYENEHDFFKKSYGFIKEDTNITYSLLIYYWGKKNNIDPYKSRRI